MPEINAFYAISKLGYIYTGEGAKIRNQEIQELIALKPLSDG